jgi:serine/threonine-protein kinase HipA
MTSSREDTAKHSAHLVALVDGRVVGAVRRDARARLQFTYEDVWRNADDAYPISLSMPLTARDTRSRS